MLKCENKDIMKILLFNQIGVEVQSYGKES